MPRARFVLRRHRSRKALTLLLLALGWASLPAASQPDGESVEHRVKAAFLFKFAKFVEWPDRPGDSMSFCVLGGDGFGDTLEQTVSGKSIKGIPISVNRLRAPGDLDGCSVLFVANSETKRVRDILGQLEARSVLTVGESARFARNGGVINFIVEKGRVHFEINVAAAERAGLKLSSKLLSLAHIVDSSGRAER